MTQTTLLVKETISTVQAQIDLLENCLQSADSEHEQTARLAEIANCRGVPLHILIEEMRNVKQIFEKSIRLSLKIYTLISDEQLPLLEIVKNNFLIKEVVEKYPYLINKQVIRSLTISCVGFYTTMLSANSVYDCKDNSEYVITESLKHELNALLNVGLQYGVFSESEINNFNLGNITSQESEDVILFLSTKIKWQPIYDRLAKS